MFMRIRRGVVERTLVMRRHHFDRRRTTSKTQLMSECPLGTEWHREAAACIHRLWCIQRVRSKLKTHDFFASQETKIANLTLNLTIFIQYVYITLKYSSFCFILRVAACNITHFGCLNFPAPTLQQGHHTCLLLCILKMTPVKIFWSNDGTGWVRMERMHL
jgi:hypothetical protein